MTPNSRRPMTKAEIDSFFASDAWIGACQKAGRLDDEIMAEIQIVVWKDLIGRRKFDDPINATWGIARKLRLKRASGGMTRKTIGGLDGIVNDVAMATPREWFDCASVFDAIRSLLDPDDQSLFDMMAAELPFEEIALRLGKTLKTTYVVCHRLRKAIKKLIPDLEAAGRLHAGARTSISPLGSLVSLSGGTRKPSDEWFDGLPRTMEDDPRFLLDWFLDNVRVASEKEYPYLKSKDYPRVINGSWHEASWTTVTDDMGPRCQTKGQIFSNARYCHNRCLSLDEPAYAFLSLIQGMKLLVRSEDYPGALILQREADDLLDHEPTRRIVRSEASQALDQFLAIRPSLRETKSLPVIAYAELLSDTDYDWRRRLQDPTGVRSGVHICRAESPAPSSAYRTPSVSMTCSFENSDVVVNIAMA